MSKTDRRLWTRSAKVTDGWQRLTPEASPRHFWPFTQLRAIYDWVLSFADRPDGQRALFFIAFAEASFFPIPPDILLIPLAVGAPHRALRFSAVSTSGSVLGAIMGYLLGLQFYEILGSPIIEFYGAHDGYQQVRALYQQWDAIAIAVAGFTPIPFKVFTITAGVFQLNFITFLVASVLSRGARFFMIGGLIRYFGPTIQRIVDQYFDLLTIVFVILLVGGFLILKYAV
jgi:membrane protein YqaA with SNARE-associated domain